MTDSLLLNTYINNSGYKRSFLAKEIGITRSGLYKKINNQTQFTAWEIQKLTQILGLNKCEQDDIFFNQ